MKLVIEIDLKEGAFHPDRNPEVHRILTEFASRVRLSPPLRNLGLGALREFMDRNGNRVGEARLEES